jgi:glycosyltransferase involved in cell wall biosynthesis
MSDTPDVSVVIPTRGARGFLPVTVEAALGQEDVTVEVIVVDDASPDGPATMPARRDDPRLRLLGHEQRRGVAAGRNTGLAAARGEWVAFLDDDDLWSPRKLRRQLDAAAASGASFSYGGAVIIDEDGYPLEPDHAPPDPNDLPAALFKFNCMPAPGSNVVAKTALVRQLGGFDENARFDDWDMLIRLAAAAPGARCAEVLTGYRRHSSNRVLATQDEVMPGVRYMSEKHRDLCVKHGAAFDELAIRRWMAWAYRRAGARRQAMRACLEAARIHRSVTDLARAFVVPFGAWAIYGPRLHRSKRDDHPWLAAYRGPLTSRPLDR